MRSLFLATLLTAAVVATAGAQAPAPDADPQAACQKAVQRARMTDDGRRRLQELMKSPKAPDLMDRLMHMADSAGSGDLVAGFERMLEAMERKQQSGG
jgi:hypothetical protein